MSLLAVTHPHAENGARIRRARERVPSPRDPSRSISQEDFAPRVPVSRRHLIRLENGEYLPDRQTRDRIVALTDTDEEIESSDDEEDVVSALMGALKRLEERRVETGDPYAVLR